MFSILSRYISREVLAPFLLGLLTFTSILILGRMMKLADMVVSKGVSVREITRLIVYLLPYFSLVTIPMALLLAVMLAFSRLSSDSEIIAMKASGISISRLLPPVMAVAAGAYLFTSLIALYAFPWGNTAFKKLLLQVVENRLTLDLHEQVFNDSFPGLMIYVDRYDEKSRQMSGILIHDDRNPQEPSTIFARQGGISSDSAARVVSLHLENGSLHQKLANGTYRLLEFRDYDLRVDAGKALRELSRNELDMTVGEMRDNLHRGGFPERLTTDMRLEIHRRFALPFACFTFALIAIPLGIQNQRSGKSAGFSVSIMVILLYYIMLSATRTLGEKGILHPAFAMWLPNLVFLCCGIALFRQAAAERRFAPLDAAIAVIRVIRNRLSPGRVQ